MKFPAWSYSALTSWESCPYRHAQTKLLKKWPDEKGEAALWGTTVHEAFENRMKNGTPLPTWGEKWEPLVQRILSAKGTVQIEHKIALNDKFQPCDFFRGPSVWVRAVADVAVYNRDSLYTLDWKTGKFKGDTDQLRLSAAINLGHLPHIQKATIQYAWLKDGKTTTETLTRADVPAIWADFMPRVERMRIGIEKEQFDKTPNGLCRAYCPVLACEFNGRRK